LRAAREEVASLAAVTEERLRIARDLHDLLGHNLSLIALKSELARRLVGVAPERAAAEIGDIESVARRALQEVREAVAGYRQPSLAGELTGAREILAAAGITYRYEGDERASQGLPAAIDAALAWAVREGVTNIIRHSHAGSCTLSLQRSTGEMGVEIVDDGISASGMPGPASEQTPGNGLRGLTERVHALGGVCEFGPQVNGGFRLYVRMPLERAERALPTSSAQPASTVTLLGGHVSAVAQRADEQMDTEARP
jgi:two-component system, NarL family, sensor histidine kinase DesK